jgi:glycosyltransferase involved in cell wall biosynthesis
MAARIIQTLADDANARAMGARGKVIVEKFSSENHLRNTIELYEELLTKHSVSSKTARLRFQADSRV